MTNQNPYLTGRTLYMDYEDLRYNLSEAETAGAVTMKYMTADDYGDCIDAADKAYLYARRAFRAAINVQNSIQYFATR